MSGPTTQEYQPLSQALQFQSQQQGFPPLPLAPSDYQKQLLALAAQAKQHHESHESLRSIIAAAQSSAECAMSISSSREVSPTVGVESSPPTSNGQKRKSDTAEGASVKKRRTDQSQQQATNLPVQYGLGSQFAYPYTFPVAPPTPGYNSRQTPDAASDMSFNEFQWRLLNLCGEFYEAATELIRSTPQLVLSQAFQFLDRGTGLDPISVLNDARRTCDMLLTRPQALSAPPPPPTALPQPALNSLAHLNARGNCSPAPAAPPVSVAPVAPPSYHPPQSTSMVLEFSPRPKEKERAPTTLQGTWKEDEIRKLKGLAEKHKIVDSFLVAEEEDEEEDEEDPSNGSHDAEVEKSSKKSKIPDVDWDKVVEEFGDGRSRHQVLIKATYLGLKSSSSLPGKKHKKKPDSAASLPPPLTTPSARSISAGHDPAQPAKGQISQGTLGGSSSDANLAPAQQKSASKPASVPTANLRKATTTAVAMSHQPPHALNAYVQPAWYPHPQNPYYAYQPLYYPPPHPQNYSIQGYGMQPPPHGYYPAPSYPSLPGSEVPPSAEKSAQQQQQQPPPKAKRKEARRDEAPAAVVAGSGVVVPPPSFPRKTPLAAGGGGGGGGAGGAGAAAASAAKTPSESIAPAAVSKPAGALPDAASGRRSSSAGAPGSMSQQSGGGLFTYAPLAHVSGDAPAEQPKEV